MRLLAEIFGAIQGLAQGLREFRRSPEEFLNFFFFLTHGWLV
jgi:hypothetical protein